MRNDTIEFLAAVNRRGYVFVGSQRRRGRCYLKFLQPMDKLTLRLLRDFMLGPQIGDFSADDAQLGRLFFLEIPEPTKKGKGI